MCSCPTARTGSLVILASSVKVCSCLFGKRLFVWDVGVRFRERGGSGEGWDSHCEKEIRVSLSKRDGILTLISD